jgi:Domain of unknown function (DUF4440)
MRGRQATLRPTSRPTSRCVLKHRRAQRRRGPVLTPGYLVSLARLTGLLGLLVFAARVPSTSAQSPEPDSALRRLVLHQDTLLFAAFNSCDTLALAQFFASDIEFYHDKAGLTVGRRLTLAPVNERCRQSAQGETPSLTRERLPADDAVYPIPGFGAMQLGRHRFTQGPFRGQAGSSAVFGFAHVWRYRDSTWQLVRVLSYDHH